MPAAESPPTTWATWVPGIGGGDDGFAAGEHAGELGGHDEVGCSTALRHEMNIRTIQQVVEARKGLEREHRHIFAVGDESFELRAEGSVSAEEEVYGLILLKGLGERREEFEALLGAHVAGVEEDRLAFEAELEAEGVGVVGGVGLDGFDVDPVGKEACLLDGDALGDAALEHLAGDAGDAGEGLGEDLFKPQGEGVDGAVLGQEAKLEGSVDLEVLHVEPAGGGACLGDEEGQGRAEEGRLDGPDDLGVPGDLTQHDGQAANHEGEEMEDTLGSVGLLRNVERGAVNGRDKGIVFAFDVEGLPAVLVPDTPCGVIGRRRHDPDVMPSCREPGRHLACVFANAGQLGRIVQPVDENAEAIWRWGVQTFPFTCFGCRPIVTAPSLQERAFASDAGVVGEKQQHTAWLTQLQIRIRTQPLAAVGAFLLVGFIVCAVFAPWLAPQDPAQLDLPGRLMQPSHLHWFGTDELGRDILSRSIYGARISMIVAVSVVSLSLALGLVAGGLAGFYGGWTDTVLNVYVTNAFLALPGILIAIAFVAFLGPGLGNLILALSLSRVGGVCEAGARAGDGGEGEGVCGGGAGAWRV